MPAAAAVAREDAAPAVPDGSGDPVPAPSVTTAPSVGLVALGLVGAFALSWAAGRSGAAATDLGRVLGRLDGSLAVILLVVAALAQRSVTARALAGSPVPSPLVGWRLVLRRVLVPWWVVVTVATFGYPTVAGQVVPSDAATPTWVEVVRDWLLLAPLGRAEAGTPWPPAGAGRLGHAWVLTAAVLLWLLLPAWERLLRAAGAGPARPAVAPGGGEPDRDRPARRADRFARPGWGPVELGAAAGTVVALAGLVLRLVVSPTGPGAWAAVARVVPATQLDVVGVGLALGALVAGARVGLGPLAHGAGATVRAAAPRLGAVTGLALVVGAAGPGVGSLLDTGGVVATLVARVGLVLVGAAVVLWALLPAPVALGTWVGARDVVARRGVPVAVGAFLVVPLAAQLWATRAGGPPGTQRLGPLVLATVAGSLAGGLALAAAGARAFGPRGERRLSPFTARLAVITGGALAWRLLTLVSINRRNPDGGDPFFYHHQANMLADRIGYSEPFRWVEQGIAVPSAIHPPLLSTWLAAGSFLGARTFLAHKLLTTLLGVAVVAVAALVARRLAGDRAALATAALVAVYPNLWVIDGALWPEGAYATVIGLAVLAAYRWWDRPDLRRAALLGTVIAVAALARGEALFLFPLLVAPLVLRRRGLVVGARVRAGLVAGACGLLVLAPWSVRNWAAFDQPVLLSTNSDEVLYYANCPDSYGRPDPHVPAGTEGAQVAGQLGYWSFNCQERERDRAGQPVASSEEADLYQRCLGDRAGEVPVGVVPGEPPGNEAEKARYWRCLGLDYARRNADRLPVVVAARIGRELDVYHLDDGLNALKFEGRPEGAAVAGRWAWWALAPLGVAGWVVLRRRRVLVLPLVALGLVVLATTVYAYGAIRFRTPLELGLLIGAGVLVDHVLRRGDRRPGAGDADGRVGPIHRADVPPSRPRRALLDDVRRGWRRLVAGRRGTALGVAIVGLAVALPLPTLFHYQGPPMEEGFMLVFPERVLAGDLPNRDFLHLYGPGSLWALAAWFKVAGTTLAAERVFGLGQHLGIIFGLFTLALPWGRRVATACGLLGVLLVITPIGLTALAWNGAVALAVIGCGLALRGGRLLDRGEPAARWWLGAGGLVLGGALLFRPDLVVGVGLALVALGWRRWRRALVVPVVAGLVVGVAPVLVHLATAGIGPSFEGMFVQPVFELRGGRTLPIPPAWDRADGALQAVAQLRTPPWPFPMFGPWPQATLWFWALPLGAVALLATGVVALRREGSPRSRTLLVVGALGVGLLPQALQRPDTTHLAWVSCVSLVFLPVAVVQWGEWWSARRRPPATAPARWARSHPGLVRTATALLPLLLVIAVIPAYTARTWVDLTRQNLEGEYFGWAVRNGDRTFYLGSPGIAVEAQAVVDELQPRLVPGQRLLVGTADLRRTPYSDAYFYFLFPQATPGTRYIEMDPGIANAPDSGLAEEVATSDWLILSHVWDAWSEPNDSRLLGSDAPNQVVRDHFCPVGDQGPSYQLWQRCR